MQQKLLGARMNFLVLKARHEMRKISKEILAPKLTVVSFGCSDTKASFFPHHVNEAAHRKYDLSY